MTQPFPDTHKRTLSEYPRHILVPTDFSEVSHHAFIYGLQLAEATGARITLLHVCHETPVDTRFAPQGFMDALRQEKIDHANSHFADYQKEAQELYKTQAEVATMVLFGYVVETITRISEELQPDMVLMGTMGEKGIGVKIIGSVTAAVIQQINIPVLAIPEGAVFQPFRHLLYATTFQMEDIPFIVSLATFAQKWDARLSCAHIKTEEEPWTRMDPEFFHEISKIETINDISLYVSNHQDIVEGLNHFADQHRVDLIAMLTHRRFEIDRLFDESMTQKMSLYTHIPLLAFHEG